MIAKRGTQGVPARSRSFASAKAGGAAGGVWGEFRRAAVPALLPPVVHAAGFRSTPASEGDTRGEFMARASAIFAPASSPLDAGAPVVDSGEDAELRNLLAAISDDVQRMAVGMCEAIAAEYGGKIDHARKTLRRDQVAGVVSMLKAARQGALAVAQQLASTELAGRREAALRAHRKGFLIVGKPLDGLSRR
jgi:hypothetical protein